MFALVGGNGYVGTAFQEFLQASGLPFHNVSRSELDYYDRSRLSVFLKDLKPAFLINAAGFTGRPNVDACELQKTECLNGNAVLPGILREVCEDLALPWGHVSSGCIYTGEKPDGSGFTEEDEPNFSFRHNNCSFYSGCKALGEEVLHGAQDCYVWRLRIPFNEVDSPRNYLTKMMRYDRLLQARNSLSHLGQFVESCVACWTSQVEFGVYNLTNPGAVTTRDVVGMLKSLRFQDREFDFFDSEEEFMKIAAKTPRSNCVLDSTKAVAAGLPLSPVEDVIEQSIRNWTA